MALSPEPLPPRAVLRIACAGSRHAEAATAAVCARARSLFESLAAAMPTLGYAPTPPLLQLLTGLADGADQLVAGVFMGGQCIAHEREHIAVLPFDEAVYREHSPIADKATFDQLLARSTLVIELDGQWLPDGEPDHTPFARHCRGRAYKAQAQLMLQRADLLLAVFDTEAEGKVGGTVETTRTALELGLPVLALAIGSAPHEPTLHLLRTVSDLEALGPWHGAPKAIAPGAQQDAEIGALVARELAPPPLRLTPLPRKSWLEALWPRFERLFSPAQTAPPIMAAQWPESASPFRQPREQLRQLNYRFAGWYRGGFLANYAFAALATALAAGSLGVMAAASESVHAHRPGVMSALLLLVFLKLALVSAILVLARAAHHDKWNENAINARYLAENLRLLLWLPSLGKLRAPRRSGEHHVHEELESQTADDLLRALVRAAPADTGLVPRSPGPPPRMRIDARAAIEALARVWVAGQIDYHRRNVARTASMHAGLTHLVERLNWVVVVCVLLDLLALLTAWLGHLQATSLDVTKVVLIVTAATLPAIVAAINGIREQSEARRLAGRSDQLTRSLEALRDEAARALSRIEVAAHTGRDPGAWTLEALALAERTSTLVAEDVAEWTVLYNKLMPDP